MSQHKVHNPHKVSLNGVHIFGDGAIHLGQGCEIRPGTIIELGSGILRLGKGSVIGYASFLQVTGEITIGEHSLLGPHCRYIASKHRVVPGKKLAEVPLMRGSIVIGNNVWLGAGVTVNTEVTLGDDCVIGANSFVRGNIPPGEVWGGVPARFLKYTKEIS
jgi:acetyltransferase-like isoleucine patch superfamily enzyme